VALASTGGQAVLLLNADCFLAPGFLAAARPRLEEGGVGSVAPRLLRTMGPRPTQRLDLVDTVGIVMHRCRKNLLAGHGTPRGAYDVPGEAFGADGAAALYRRETLQECAVEGAVFDEDFEMWASDVDLAWRARLLGWRCVYEPRAVAYHIRSYRPDTRGQMSDRDRVLVFRNRYLMMAKNDRLADLLGDLHHVVAYEALAFGYALVKDRRLMRGYVEAARLLPAAWRKRAVIQQRRRTRQTPKLTFGEEPGGRAREAAQLDAPRRTFNSQFVTLWRAVAGPRR
jgi:GT2 family glycosyltransferase